MGYIEVSESFYQEIAYRAICELLGLDKENKETKALKKNILVKKQPPSEVSTGPSGPGATPKEAVQLTIGLSAKFGEDLLGFCNKVAQKVLEEVKRITEMNVVAINIRILDVTNE